MVPGNITKQQLIDFLNQFSNSKSANVIEFPSTYQVQGQFLIDDLNIDLQSLILKVKQEIPAHLQFIPNFLIDILMQYQYETNTQISTTHLEQLQYQPEKSVGILTNRLSKYLMNTSKNNLISVILETLEQYFTTNHSSVISVIRNVMANNGGINSNGMFMDETAPKMDGSWLLNDNPQPGYDVSHLVAWLLVTVMTMVAKPSSQSIQVLRVTIEQYSSAHSSQLSITRDATETIQAIKNVLLAFSRFIQSGFNYSTNNLVSLLRTVQEQYFATNHSDAISVNRVIGAPNNQYLMTGAWILDGTITMNRSSAYPMTVIINGTQV